MSMNKVFLVGRTTKDVEKKELQSGQSVASFSLAVDRAYANKEGTREADFIPITAWGKLAENLEQYTKKGTLISVVGRLQRRSYKDKNGKDVYVMEVIAEEISFLAKPQGDKENKSVSKKAKEEKTDFEDKDFTEIGEEDIDNLFSE